MIQPTGPGARTLMGAGGAAPLAEGKAAFEVALGKAQPATRGLAGKRDAKSPIDPAHPIDARHEIPNHQNHRRKPRDERDADSAAALAVVPSAGPEPAREQIKFTSMVAGGVPAPPGPPSPSTQLEKPAAPAHASSNPAPAPRTASVEANSAAHAPAPASITAVHELRIATTEAGSLVAEVTVRRTADGGLDLHVQPAYPAAAAQLRANLPELRRQLATRLAGATRILLDEDGSTHDRDERDRVGQA